MKLKKGIAAFSASFVLCAVVAVFVFKSDVTAQYIQKKMQFVESMVWYNFEGDGSEAEFSLVGSSFLIKDDTRTFVKYYDYVPYGLGEKKSDSKKSLGVAAAFERKGYNWIDIKPDPVKAKKKFPGVVKSLDMWVWGGNFNYNLQVVLEDYKNYRYALDMGNLAYYGWRNLMVPIAGSIPQEESHVPRTKGLSFVKFRIYSTPAERVDRFRCFFDYFKIVTDAYREQYDGWELEEKIAEEIGELSQIEGKNVPPPAGK